VRKLGMTNSLDTRTASSATHSLRSTERAVNRIALKIPVIV
jgi:hypothetical protein